MKNAIFGFGRVGQALEEVYISSLFGQPLIKDLNRNDYKGYKKLEVLNICIPYSNDFINIVCQEINNHQPKLTIIHSTVPPYTTREIRYQTKLPVVHSPIRGPKDKLAKSLIIFIKYIGAETKKDAKLTRDHLVSLGITKNKIFKRAVCTEINKLISTTYYAHNIVFTDYVKFLLDEYKVNFDTFKHFNDSYNRGYRRLRRKEKNRLTLIPTENGKIDNSWMIENAKILDNKFHNNITSKILEYE